MLSRLPTGLPNALGKSKHCENYHLIVETIIFNILDILKYVLNFDLKFEIFSKMTLIAHPRDFPKAFKNAQFFEFYLSMPRLQFYHFGHMKFLNNI